MKKIKVLGFGDNVVDRYEHKHIMYPGGNAVNFAVFAKQFGASKSAYMGIFGNDEAGEHVISSLQEEGIELVKCKQVIGENGCAKVTVIDNDRIFLGSNEGGIRGDHRYVLDRFDLAYMKQFDLVHTGNYSFTERELPKMKQAGIVISFDFSDDSTQEYYQQIAPYVDYAFMSCSEMTLEETKEQLKEVVSYGPKFACASRGAQGCIAYDGNEFYEQAAKPIENIKDTMAAGDSLLSAFLVGYLEAIQNGISSKQAIISSLDQASSFAAKVCGMEGSWGHGKAYSS